MDPVEADLKFKLAQPFLSPKDVKEGITACFILTNRQFFTRRLGDRPTTYEADTTTIELVDQVFGELGIDPEKPSLGTLREAWKILDQQLGLEADPDRLAHHNQIIGSLFGLAGDKG